MRCGRERSAAGGRASRRASAEMAKPVVRAGFGPCDRAACLAESHLSHSIPLIPLNPTYPTESHLSRSIPLNPAYPTESHLSHSIPLNPDESRIRIFCSIPPPPVPLPTHSFPPIAGHSLRSLGSAPFGARRGRAVRAFGPGGAEGVCGGTSLFSLSSTYSFPSIAGRSLRSIVRSARVDARHSAPLGARGRRGPG